MLFAYAGELMGEGEAQKFMDDNNCTFCIAFGIILSISKMARNQIREQEEAVAPLYESTKDDVQVAMDVLEQIDNE